MSEGPEADIPSFSAAHKVCDYAEKSCYRRIEKSGCYSGEGGYHSIVIRHGIIHGQLQ